MKFDVIPCGGAEVVLGCLQQGVMANPLHLGLAHPLKAEDCEFCSACASIFNGRPDRRSTVSQTVVAVLAHPTHSRRGPLASLLLWPFLPLTLTHAFTYTLFLPLPRPDFSCVLLSSPKHPCATRRRWHSNRSTAPAIAPSSLAVAAMHSVSFAVLVGVLGFPSTHMETAPSHALSIITSTHHALVLQPWLAHLSCSYCCCHTITPLFRRLNRPSRAEAA